MMAHLVGIELVSRVARRLDQALVMAIISSLALVSAQAQVSE